MSMEIQRRYKTGTCSVLLVPPETLRLRLEQIPYIPHGREGAEPWCQIFCELGTFVSIGTHSAPGCIKSGLTKWWKVL